MIYMKGVYIIFSLFISIVVVIIILLVKDKPNPNLSQTLPKNKTPIPAPPPIPPPPTADINFQNTYHSFCGADLAKFDMGSDINSPLRQNKPTYFWLDGSKSLCGNFESAYSSQNNPIPYTLSKEFQNKNVSQYSRQCTEGNKPAPCSTLRNNQEVCKNLQTNQLGSVLSNTEHITEHSCASQCQVDPNCYGYLMANSYSCSSGKECESYQIDNGLQCRFITKDFLYDFTQPSGVLPINYSCNPTVLNNVNRKIPDKGTEGIKSFTDNSTGYVGLFKKKLFSEVINPLKNDLYQPFNQPCINTNTPIYEGTTLSKDNLNKQMAGEKAEYNLSENPLFSPIASFTTKNRDNGGLDRYNHTNTDQLTLDIIYPAIQNCLNTFEDKNEPNTAPNAYYNPQCECACINPSTTEHCDGYEVSSDDGVTYTCTLYKYNNTSPSDLVAQCPPSWMESIPSTSTYGKVKAHIKVKNPPIKFKT